GQAEVRADRGPNQADQLVYAAEKAMSDLGEKVDPAKRSEVEDQVRRLKEMLEQDAGIAELRRGIEKLSKASQEIASEAYKQAQAEAGGSATTADSAGASADSDQDDDGEYIDAEYDEPR
ncbi:Hsp70 family protein, partial [Candidatus Bipolaricaulota bacterium]|nr:Hsp70 family protein [Candidatus Bipolaricaulota bacterium]